ncbi:hypothetical protein AOQ71_04000 [Bradyrhizobium manausense]|uniref:Uncharacterized protein n=1 Tax=Bradyrhizobium manausense TaxID=989370 RepID=A0A0R3EA70_9BRAD|nr:hypothetical protein AOQ71_04000 [Bradyrhizobium manausense]
MVAFFLIFQQLAFHWIRLSRSNVRASSGECRGGIRIGGSARFLVLSAGGRTRRPHTSFQYRFCPQTFGEGGMRLGRSFIGSPDSDD